MSIRNIINKVYFLNSCIRQTNRETDYHRDKQTYRWADRLTERQTKERQTTDKQTNRQTD